MTDEALPTATTDKGSASGAWERELIEKLTLANITEQRRSRRWNIFFKLFFVLYLLALPLIMFFKGEEGGGISGEAHTALVEVKGLISADEEASADNVISGLRAAFKDKDTKAVILRINSPGGTPVQAGYINDEIFRLKEKYPQIPLYAVLVDICASGGYYVASAADKIYADKATLVGSIGVIMEGFGFNQAMEKLGVERRVITAGAHKALLDPFSPVNPENVAHLQKVLGNVHEQFINVVKKGRGERLKTDNPDLFTGLVWTGEKSVELGLVDALGSSGYVARDVVKAEKIVNFTERKSYLDQVAKRFGVALENVIAKTLREVAVK